MSQREKLIERFKTLPKDFTFDELCVLLACFGYRMEEKAGSRVRFVNVSKDSIKLHRPHPGKIMKVKTLKEVYTHLDGLNIFNL